jgi:hypothetical protein
MRIERCPFDWNEIDESRKGIAEEPGPLPFLKPGKRMLSNGGF